MAGGDLRVAVGLVCDQGNYMVIELPSPTCPPLEPGYEVGCRAALNPMLGEILDLAESAGWERRRAAYDMMMLAAEELKKGRKSEVENTDDPPSAWSVEGGQSQPG